MRWSCSTPRACAQTLDDLVLRRAVPVLGVCVGMQMMAQGSDEGRRPGLGWIPGCGAQLPHGRCRGGAAAAAHGLERRVSRLATLRLFAGLERDARFYFLHSFYFECADPAHRAADTHYGLDFACAVHKDTCLGRAVPSREEPPLGLRLC